MSRKKPSSHSDAQIAFFVEKVGSRLSDIDQARFAAMVRGLVRTDPEPRRMVVAQESSQENVGEPADLLPRLRQLGFQWSNSERLLIRLMAILLDSDAASAEVVFSTLAGTHVRVDLVRRLAMLKVADRQTRSDLDKAIGDFDEAGRVRRELIQNLFTVPAGGDLDESEAMDRQQAAAVIVASDNLDLVGRALESLMPRLSQAMRNGDWRRAAE